MPATFIIRLASRKSPLALIQSEMVKAHINAVFPEVTVKIIPIQTSGDKNTHRSLADIGGKGLFTKELEEGLLAGTFDIAVHSLKDMETHLTHGLIIGAVLEREDARDAIIIHSKEQNLLKLKQNAVIGTSSARRTAQLKIMRPDFAIIPFRGNVATRLNKLSEGHADATMLAYAGLKRLGMAERATTVLDEKEFIPAVGQGIIAIECLEQNTKIREMLHTINHEPSFIAAVCERAMLARLDGSCRTPIAGHAVVQRGYVQLEGLVASMDGTFHVKTLRAGSQADAQAIGYEVGDALLKNGGAECLATH